MRKISYSVLAVAALLIAVIVTSGVSGWMASSQAVPASVETIDTSRMTANGHYEDLPARQFTDYTFVYGQNY